MTEPDIIRIDGEEYDVQYGPYQDCAIKRYFNVVLAKKRKQTGWICRACGAGERGVCVRDSGPSGPTAIPDRCLYDCGVPARWRPFYGTITEEPYP